MSGYKRVNFYELCRLCASNQQKEKTHIFHEEGRKIQLQTKIQSLLSLKVCENDYLPKVVCSRCLQCLEECYTFRNECVTSEEMLSTYFNNYRYKEEFTKSGKVYIKDTAPNKESFAIPPEPEITVLYPNVQELKPPLLPPQQQILVNMKPKQPLPLPPPPPHQETITINANGEINIASLIDFDGILGPTPPQPPKKMLKQSIMQPPKKKIQEALMLEDSYKKGKIKIEGGGNVIVNPISVPTMSNSRNVTVPMSAAITTQSYQNVSSVTTQKILETAAQKIVENFAPQTCYYANAIGYTSQQVEQTISLPHDVKPTIVEQPPIDQLNTISPNWTESITIPQQHQQPEKPKPPKPPPPAPPTPTSSSDPHKTFECEMCKKTFKRREHLYQHVKLHTGFRPFTCENCNKSFMRKEHLLRHMTSHSGLKNFTCNICEKSFSRNDNLLKHKKTHDKESNFTCEVCQKVFIMRHYYVAHKATHETENKGPLVWSVKA